MSYLKSKNDWFTFQFRKITIMFFRMIYIVKMHHVLSLLLCLCFSRNLDANDVENKDKDILLQNKHVSLHFADSTIYFIKKFTYDDKELIGTKVTHPWELTYRGVNDENPKL